MIELRPPGTTVQTKAQSSILLPNYWLRFSDKFPDYLSHVKGKTMKVLRQQQVSFQLSWTIKENCYKDINLSNDDTGEKLFPDSQENLYETLIALGEGNWSLIPYFPAEQPLYRLDYVSMIPLLADAKLRYLGNIRPSDSPYLSGEQGFSAWGASTFKLYTMYQLKPIILRLVADGGQDYEKCTLHFLINRCMMKEGTPPDNVVPKPIEYLDALKF